MSLVVIVMVVALAVGWLRGGSLDRLGSHPLRARALVVLALLVQLVGTLVGGPLHPVGLAVSAALVVAFLARNRGLRGTGLVALGLLANALVVGLNGAMPVRLEAAARAGTGVQALVLGDTRHELEGPATRLRLLGDVIPVPLPVRPEVVSVGDVLVAAGLGQLVALGMVHGPGTPRPRGVPTPQGRQRRALPALPSWTSVASPSAPRPGGRAS
ncbi:MAG: DUF5317 domain-containing protein [Frankiaceae bacterium]|nr:DUF5317 domain-containing protein [Frankiaceae bacterium]